MSKNQAVKFIGQVIFKVKFVLIISIVCFNTLEAQYYNFRTIDLDEEFGIKNVSDVYSSVQGYLLIAGRDNIYSFDGKSVDILVPELEFDFSKISHLSKGFKNILAFLKNDQLFIKRVNQESFKIPLNEKINHYAIFEDLIFLGTDNGIKIYNLELNFLKAYDEFESLEDLSINQLQFDSNTLIICTENGIYLFDTDVRSIRLINKTSNINIQGLIKDLRGNFWAYDLKGNILQFDSTFNLIKTFNNPSYTFNDILCDKKNRLWFSSSNKGLLRFDQNENIWKIIDVSNGLPDNRIVDLTKDEWGSIWIALANNSLSRFIDKDFEWFNVYNQLPNDLVNAISSNRKKLLFSCKGKGVYSLINGDFNQVMDQSILEGSDCSVIAQNGEEIWIGTKGSGAIRLKDREYTFFRKEAGIPSNWISQIAIDSTGNTWIGTVANGISLLNQSDSSSFSVINYGLENGLEDLHVTAIYVSVDNRIYYGTQSGKLGYFFEGIHNAILSEMRISEISDITGDGSGKIYFATSDTGIFEYTPSKNPTIKPLLIDGLNIPSEIYSIVSKNDDLWISNDNGIHKLKIDNNQTQLNRFSIVDGFPTSKVITNGMVSLDDNIWIASSSGLIRIGDIGSTDQEKIPKIHLAGVQVNYNDIGTSESSIDNLEMSYNENQISFSFKAIDINSNKELLYSHILIGLEKQWSPWTKNEFQNYNNLGPGQYTFKVKARSILDIESDEISIPFIIKGPIWKKWWFIPSLIFLAFSSFFLIFRTRYNALKKKSQEEKTKLELKNRLLELEQKANQLQMNPHFIFNALNSIQATVSKEDFQLARKEINDFAVLMRSILSNSKERVIPLEDEIKLLEKYIEVEKTCRSLNFKHKIRIEKDIDVEEVLIPPMLIQPFVENAIVHGLKSKGDSGELEIEFKLETEDRLLISIKDNGAGYMNTQKAKDKKSHKPIAIQVTKERLQNLLPKLNDKVLEISQIEEGGTMVKIRMPIEYNY